MTCKIQLITMLIIFFSSIIYNFTQNFILYKKKTIKQEIKILTTWKIYHIRNSQLLKLCLSAKLRFYDSISQIPRRASPFKKFIESETRIKFDQNSITDIRFLAIAKTNQTVSNPVGSNHRRPSPSPFFIFNVKRRIHSSRWRGKILLFLLPRRKILEGIKYV